ncbi:MAG: hypothetical protein C0601_04355 [Candidatus Muiribacterium halophilum]|uniref:STAS domain-containing protein n=1 Tax=Muiribacterium halophilum TaxID=2053465 RepID=A0A2N5ZIR7_MUIH1|nr:MAG: hypothetical protein C0601_04355 [Candidatus Muirbacterium halophilum]
MAKITLNEKKDRYFLNFSGSFSSDEDSNELIEMFNQAKDIEPKQLVLNFKETKYLNSSIIGILIKYYQLMPNTKMYIYCENEFLKDLFKITSLDQFFENLENENEV